MQTWRIKEFKPQTSVFLLYHFYYAECFLFFLFKRVLDQGPEQRESKMTVLCPLIIIILISYIIIYYIIIYYIIIYYIIIYYIIIKLLIMENHPSRNQK